MKLSRSNLSNIWERISTLRSAAVVGIASLTSYFLLAIMANSSIVSSYFFELNFSVLISLIPSLVAGYHNATATFVLLTTIATSVLVGINMALLTQVITKEGATGGLTGTLLSMTVSGCAACTTGVISLAGTSIGVSFLPYNGLEINILGISLLGYTALYISEKDRQKFCKI